MLSLGILLVVVTGRLVSVWGWFEGSSEKLDTRRLFFFSEISLSRSFCLFSLCRYPDGVGSRVLKVGHAVAVVSRGFRETRRSRKNSRVYMRLSFFFFFFFLSFSGHYNLAFLNFRVWGLWFLILSGTQQSSCLSSYKACLVMFLVLNLVSF